MEHRESNPRSGPSNLWWLLLPVVVLVLSLPTLNSLVRHPHQNYQITRAKANLRSIAQGLVVYSGRNKDVFPRHSKGLEVLVGEGYIEPELLKSSYEDGDEVSYFFVPGVNTFNPEEILVYEDPKHHDEGVLVGFVDSHVEFVDFERFELMIAELPEWRTPIPYVSEPVEP